MRQNLTLFLFLCSLFGFAQLYVQEGETLSFGTSDALLSSQEHFHQIDAPILGKGTLVLNGLEPQSLESNQEVLEITNLTIQNADLIHINTPLRVAQHFTLQSGELHLEQPLYLPNPQALVLLGNSSLQNIELLVFDLQQIDHTQPHWVWTHSPISYFTTQTHKGFNCTEIPTTHQTNFGRFISTYKTLYFQNSSPPPEAKSLA